MKRIFAFALVLALAMFGVAAAQAENWIILPENEAAVETIEGMVTEVHPIFERVEDNDVIAEGKLTVYVQTEDVGLVSFVVNADVYSPFGKPLEQVAAGDRFIGSYDASLPMTMIYPPRYMAIAAEIR